MATISLLVSFLKLVFSTGFLRYWNFSFELWKLTHKQSYKGSCTQIIHCP